MFSGIEVTQEFFYTLVPQVPRTSGEIMLQYVQYVTPAQNNDKDLPYF